MLVGDVVSRERSGEILFIELRVTFRARQRPNVRNDFDFIRSQCAHEIFDRACGVANGPEPRDQTFASVKVLVP